MTYSISKRWNIELDILIEEIGNSIFPHPLQFKQDIAFVRSSSGILEYHRTIYPDDLPGRQPGTTIGTRFNSIRPNDGQIIAPFEIVVRKLRKF